MAEWVRLRNIVALPTGWQRPARTEEWAYETCVRELPDSPFAEMLCFPWASHIDLSRRGRAETAARFSEALKAVPPKRTIVRATVMQHIRSLDALETLRKIGVTDLFWSHATCELENICGIRIHPFPLYAYCAHLTGSQGPWICPPNKRYLYSFIGAYDPGGYMTQARRWIFDMTHPENACVISRPEWHFESAVYREQIDGNEQSEDSRMARREWEREYADVMQESVFTLCPSGSGPNTIRLWEAIAMGSIPVIIANSCRLPGPDELWERATLRVAEDLDTIRVLPERLAAMAADKVQIGIRHDALRRLSRYFSLEALHPGIRDLFSTRAIMDLISAGSGHA
jgi:hypothetical protein